jgi:hypothetical protein
MSKLVSTVYIYSLVVFPHHTLCMQSSKPEVFFLGTGRTVTGLCI